MLEFIRHLFETDFMPHGHCYYWQKDILIPIVVGDCLTVISYTAIPFILWKYVRRRKDIKFGFVFRIFAAFILFCGIGHFIDIVNIWEPYYRVTAISKMCTGLISIASLIVFIKLFPKALKIPSPEQLEEVNKQIQQKNIELSDLHDSYEDVMKTARLGHWELNLNTNHLYWSPMVYEIHELPVGSSVSLEKGISFYHPDYIEMISGLVKDCIETGTPWDEELKLITAKKQTIWVRAIGKRVLQDGGEIVIRGLFQDITVRKHRDSKIAESESALREAESIAKMGSWRWDLDSGKVIWSEGHYKLFGYQPEDVHLSQEFDASLIHSEDRDVVRKLVLKAIENREEFEVIHRAITKDGLEKTVVNKAVPYVEGFSKGNVYKGVVMDITEEFKAKKDLEVSLSALKRSNRELQDFAYVASHDLQEPLRVITSYLQLLEMSYQDKLDEEGLMFINKTIKASSRMKTLINDLLTLSRLETVEVREDIVDLNEIIGQVLEGLQVKIQETNSQINYSKLPKVLGDKSRLYQLFQNLIGNAIKFRKKDIDPIIEINARELENGIEVEVKDNGIGIKNEYRERIFTIFQRLHTREEYPGTGIGLAICKKIVERHGFDIKVESVFGEGTSFIFGLRNKK